MKLIDKLLLFLMVILLPSGLLAAYVFIDTTPPTSSTTDAAAIVDTQKLEQVIRSTVEQAQPKQDQPKTFQISSVSYASESGILRLSGKAPSPQASILVTTTLFKKPDPAASPTPSPKPGQQQQIKLGNPVELFSVLPDEQSNFVYEYFTQELTGVVEIRLEQNDSFSSLRFDLEKKKQVL